MIKLLCYIIGHNWQLTSWERKYLSTKKAIHIDRTKSACKRCQKEKTETQESNER